MSNLRVRKLTEIAIAAALSFILSLIKLKINQSYGISLGLIPIFWISMRRGTHAGLLTGFVYGLLRLVTGNFFMLSVLQVIVEYIFAFMCAGFSGLFVNKFQHQLRMNQTKQAVMTLGIATFVGAAIEYFVHFVAGVIYWGQYAPENLSPVMFSAIANGASGFFTWLAAFIVLTLLLHISRRLFIPK